jgi:hypothetical protein
LLLRQWLESVKAKASNIRMAEKSYTFWASDDCRGLAAPLTQFGLSKGRRLLDVSQRQQLLAVVTEWPRRTALPRPGESRVCGRLALGWGRQGRQLSGELRVARHRNLERVIQISYFSEGKSAI